MPDPTERSASARVTRRGLAVLVQGIRDEPWIFAFSVTGSGIYGLMTIGTAYVLGAVTDRVIEPDLRSGHAAAGSLVIAALAILAVGMLRAVGIVGRRLGAGVIQYRLMATYRRRVTRQYLALPLSWHQRHPAGELLSNANADVEAMWYPFAPFPFAVGVVLMLIVTAILLLVTDPLTGLVGCVVFPAVALLNIAYSRRLSPVMTRGQQQRADVSGVAHESFDGALVVKALGREADETTRFRASAEALRDTMIRVGRIRGLFDPLMEALPNLGVLVVLLVGSARVESGALDTGQLVRVAFLFTLLAFPIRAIGWVLGELPRSVVGADRVRRVLAATGAQEHGIAGLDRDSAAELALDSVSYAYTDEGSVLSEVTFDVAPGRTVALVGPTGSGKSTLVGLLVRLVDPDGGAVLLDGTDLRALRAGEIPRAAALVGQQTFLFDDTVRGNVTLDDRGGSVSDDDVWAALRLAQADRFVRALPDGLDTLVGERGTTLSGGQRQRIALARALVRRPRLLILDDATSSVDPQVEAAILAGLRDSALPSTVVVVAYRRATIALADEVVYVERGRVLARGTHAELMATQPGYELMVTAYARAEAEREAERGRRREAAPA